MIRPGDLRARWTTLAVAALCALAWLGNAAHVAVAPHGHHDSGFVHGHDHPDLAERSAPATDGQRGIEPHPRPYEHDVDDHRLAEADRVQQWHLVALPEPEPAPELVLPPLAGPRPPALDEDPPDPAPPSGALRLRAPPVG